MISDSPSPPGGKRSHDDIDPPDIEDMGQKKRHPVQTPPTVTKHLQTPSSSSSSQQQSGGSWRTVLGPPPDLGTTKVGVVIVYNYNHRYYNLRNRIGSGSDFMFLFVLRVPFTREIKLITAAV